MKTSRSFVSLSLAVLLGPVVTAWPAPTTNDDFNRTASSGWGSTPQSQSYTVSGGTSSDFSVASNRGQIKFSSIANRLTRLNLGLTHVEGTVRLALNVVPTAQYAFAGPAVRIQASGTDYYYFRLKPNAAGDVTLLIQKIIGGSQTPLSAEVLVGTGYTAGAYYRVRFSAAGTNSTFLRAKAWKDGDPEPNLWSVEITDSTAILQASGGAGIRAGTHSNYTPLNSFYDVDDFQVHNVNFVANLKTAMQTAVAGDILYFTGTHTGPMVTGAHGTATAPIIVRGLNATARNSGTQTGYGVQVIHHYWQFDNFTVDNTLKGVYVNNADHGVLTNIGVTHSFSEGFKFRRYSNYWEVDSCTVDGTGEDGGVTNDGEIGEGFYIGDATSNWETPTTPDTTGYITLRNCYAINTTNDHYDIKEGAHHVKLINCEADFTGAEPIYGSSTGDSGFYLRGDDIQVIDCYVHDLGNGGTAYNVSNKSVNGITYGHRVEFTGVSAVNIGNGAAAGAGAMFEIHNNCTGVKIYDDCTATNVETYKTGSGSYTTPAAATFVELTW